MTGTRRLCTVCQYSQPNGFPTSSCSSTVDLYHVPIWGLERRGSHCLVRHLGSEWPRFEPGANGNIARWLEIDIHLCKLICIELPHWPRNDDINEKTMAPYASLCNEFSLLASPTHHSPHTRKQFCDVLRRTGHTGSQAKVGKGQGQNCKQQPCHSSPCVEPESPRPAGLRPCMAGSTKAMQTTLHGVHGVLSKMTHNANESNFSHTCALLTWSYLYVCHQGAKTSWRESKQAGAQRSGTWSSGQESLSSCVPKLDTLRSR